MTPRELLEKCALQESFGLTRIMLVQPATERVMKSFSKKVRTPFGMAEKVYIGENGLIGFWIEIKKVRRWVFKVLEANSK